MSTPLMKGHSWEAHSHKVQYPVILQAKVDEIRGYVEMNDKGEVSIVSYSGKPLYNLEPLHNTLWAVMTLIQVRSLDIGILCNGNFTDSNRLIKSKRGVPEDLKDAPLVAYLFDIPDLWLEEQSQRIQDLQRVATTSFPCLRVPPTVWCYSEEEVMEEFQRFRGMGYEGAMVKDPKAQYAAGKRSTAWLKLKPFETFDGKITEVNQAFAEDGTPHDRAGSVTVELEDGSTARVGGLIHHTARLMFQFPEDYIGEWIEFECMERASAGGYRHPRFIRFREAKQ